MTRAIHCFYSMGHSEMLLAVAGLDKNSLERENVFQPPVTTHEKKK